MPVKVVYSSWSEAIRGYEAQKKTLPWTPDQYHPQDYRRVTKYEVSRREREFDPVGLKYRDAGREEKQAVKERERLAKQRQDARTKQLLMGQRWDIISNEVFPDAPPKAPKHIRPRQPDSNAKYNILNNVSLPKHKGLKMVTVDNAVILPTPRQVLLDGGKQPLSHFKREFDVISNHYHHHHEQRLLQDEQRLREDSQKKYWRTHDYNLLEGRYYDEEKERQFQARREELAKVHGEAKQERIPASYKYSEGHAFDVINNSVKDPLKSSLIVTAGLRGIKAKKKTAIEAFQKARAATVEETWEARRANRVSAHRYEPEAERGYNVITNTVFQGEGRAEHAPHRALVRPSHWARLQAAATLTMTSPSASTAPAPLESLLMLGKLADHESSMAPRSNQAEEAEAAARTVRRAMRRAQTSGGPALATSASAPALNSTRGLATAGAAVRTSGRQQPPPSSSKAVVPPLALQQAASAF